MLEYSDCCHLKLNVPARWSCVNGALDFLHNIYLICLNVKYTFHHILVHSDCCDPFSTLCTQMAFTGEISPTDFFSIQKRRCLL